MEICKAWRAIPAFLAGSYGILGTSLGALEHPLGVSGGILVVFGRLWGAPWMSFDILLEAGGRKIVEILSQDDNKDRLELEICDFRKIIEKTMVFH